MYYHAIKCKWDGAKRPDLSIAWIKERAEREKNKSLDEKGHLCEQMHPSVRWETL